MLLLNGPQPITDAHGNPDRWQEVATPSDGWVFARDLCTGKHRICGSNKSSEIRSNLTNFGLVEVRSFSTTDNRKRKTSLQAMRLWREQEGFELVFRVILANERLFNAYKFGYYLTDNELVQTLTTGKGWHESKYRKAMKRQEQKFFELQKEEIDALANYLKLSPEDPDFKADMKKIQKHGPEGVRVYRGILELAQYYLEIIRKKENEKKNKKEVVKESSPRKKRGI